MVAFRSMAWAAFVAMMLFGAIGAVVLYVCKLDQRTWLPTQMFPNVGNMGLPLCLLAFGDEGLALSLTYFMVNVVFALTLGMVIASGRLSLLELVKSPMFIGVVITLVFIHGQQTAGVDSGHHALARRPHHSTYAGGNGSVSRASGSRASSAASPCLCCASARDS